MFDLQRRFLCHDEDDDDDCETVAPDPIDLTAELGDVQNDSTRLAAQAALIDGSPRPFSSQASPNMSTPSSASGLLVKTSLLAQGVEPSKVLLRAKSSMSSRICRICLCEAEDDDIDNEVNPLVAPCECKGSMKWVHLLCLRTWMAGRLNIRNVSGAGRKIEFNCLYRTVQWFVSSGDR